jgi:hypothetical protein
MYQRHLQLLQAFEEKGRRQALQPVLHVFCFLVTPLTLDGQKFLEAEKQVIITW